MTASGLDALPPMVLALIALVSGVAWQIAGTLLLFRWTPRSMSEGIRLILAWFLWLPVSGALELALCLAHVGGRQALLVCTGIVALGALASVSTLLRAGALLRGQWQRWAKEATSLEWWFFRAGTLLQAIVWLYAAHPQRLIDQLNYHLVVGHLAVRDGEPFTGTYDPHVSLAGVVEYGLAWHQAWTHSTLLFVAMAQVAVLLGTVPVLIACALRIGGGSIGLLGALLFAIPTAIPEWDVLRTAKPDGIVLAGTVLVLTLLAERIEGGLFVATALLALMIAAKVTAVHACLALVPCVLLWRAPRGRARDFVPLFVLGFGALALQLGKNWAYLGAPFYPVGASLFHSAVWDDAARAYWRDVAYEYRPWWMGWLGPFVLATRAGSMIICLVAAAALVRVARTPGFHRDSRSTPRGPLAPTPSPLQPRTGPRTSHSSLTGEGAPGNETKGVPRFIPALLTFIAAYWVVWPAFYGLRISPRFLAPLLGAILLLWLALYARLPRVRRPVLWAACVVAGLLSSEIDIALPRLWAWNGETAVAAMTAQWARLPTALALNQVSGPPDVIVADRPEKLFFEATVISDSPYSPRERATIEELAEHPREAAERMRIRAIVIDRTRPMSPLIARAWAALERDGMKQEIGDDQVLWIGSSLRPPRTEAAVAP